MKISANRDDLLTPLLQIGGVVERRQTLPILANVLIRAKRDRLSLTATDLEVELTTTALATADDEMDFTLPARKLIEICKALPEGADISLELNADKVVLKSGRGRYTLGMLPAQDYPSIDPSVATDFLVLKEGVLKRLIEKTSFAIAQQDVRYYLNGLMLEITPGRIRVVATDGHRMALSDAKTEDTGTIDLQIILPRKAVLELGRLLTDSENEVRIEISNSHIRVQLDNASFISKLIDGRFPDYERVLPCGETFEVFADRDLLRKALARTAILSNEKYRGIRFRLGKGLLHLQAHNPEQDEAEEEVEIEYTGDEMTIGFNVGYLLDVLGVIEQDEVQISVIDSNSSSLITEKGSTDSRYVVMPMRL